ncbi:MAG: 5'-deoxynucleotidase [Clostridia bacterium]|nr:5'-deoxynucleotidase [Clostridia bacterium]
MENGFYAMLFRMKHINRWGIMHSLIPDTLSSHSLEVAFIAHSLAMIGNEYFEKNYDCDSIAVKAMYHDVPEIFTGDIPTPVKYFSEEMKNSYSAVEEASINKLLSMLPDELRPQYEGMFRTEGDEHILIKAADRISAYIKCREESRLGSNEFIDAGERLYKAIKDMNCPEADKFMEEFLAAFDLPIDSILSE